MTHKFYFIRHAESEGNLRPDVIGGQSNHLAITPRGVQQARALGQRLLQEGISFTQVWASTARRAQETAFLFCEILGFPQSQIQYSPALLELSQGEWEGQARAEKYNEATMQRLREDVWNFKAPGGESQKEVEDRMVGFLEQLHTKIKEEEARIAIVSHGLAIRCLLRGLLNFDPPMTYRTLTENTSITQVNHYANGWGLVRINDAAHLAETGSLEQDFR